MNKLKHIDRKSRLSLLKMCAFALILGFGGSYLLRFSFAATGTSLFVSPSSASVLKNDNFKIEVRLNTGGEKVDGVEAYLTYPADKLQFGSVSGDNSAFGIELPSGGGGGEVHIRRLINPDVSPTVTGSNLLVATITMKALAGSGVAVVNYTANSRVTAPSAGNGSVLAATIGGSYNLTSPPPVAAQTSPPPTSPPPPASSGAAAMTGGSAKTGTTKKTTTTTTPTPSPVVPVVAPTPVSTSTAPVPSSLKTTYTPTSTGKKNLTPVIASVGGIILLVGSAFVAIRLALKMHQHLTVPAMGLVSAGSQQAYNGTVHKFSIQDPEPVVISPTQVNNNSLYTNPEDEGHISDNKLE